MKRLLISCNFLLIPCFLFSQNFGGIPPSVKWKQINTDTARVIFPAGLDSQALRVAAIVHWLAGQKPNAIGSEIHKINIVLQNQTTIANGYVSLAPFRSEYFLTPAFNNFELGSLQWHEELAVHEYRHVQQFNNFRHGLSKAFYYLLGEGGLLVATGAAIPDWFFEGDAVYNETVLTNQGRGRLPLFLNQYKSLWLANKNYSWMKLRNGSLKDFVPTHYPLGYLLVNYGYEKYGPDFWKKVTRDASAFKGLFYPFQRAIKKYAGVDFDTFTRNAFDYYKTNGVGKDEKISSPSQDMEPGIKNITKPNRKFATNYFYPFRINDDSLLYLKSSYRQINAFYIRDKMGDHRLAIKDISLDEHFSYRNGKIIYAAFVPDARWSWRDYSVIRVIDIFSGRKQQISKKTKYFTPDISGDGSKIVAVQLETSGKSELHILEAKTGKVIQRIKSAEISLFTDPKFIDENSVVTAVRLHDGRMAMALVDIIIGSIERLTPLSYNVVGFPSYYDGMIYFTGSYSGNDDLFALRMKDRKIFQLTSSALGNYFVNASPNKLVFSSYTADGYQLRELDLKQILPNEVNQLGLQESVVHWPVSQTNINTDILLDKVKERNFVMNDYKKSSHLFNFHSWRPYYEDPEFTFSLFSDNVLNTFSTELFYRYNQNEKTNGVGFNSVYAGFYPYISGGMDYTFSRPVTINNRPAIIDEWQSHIGLSVPLNFSNGLTYKFFNIGSSYVFNQQKFKGAFKDSIGNSNYSYLSHFISWNQQVQMARQHIYPKFAYNFSVNLRHVISKYRSYQFLSNGALYLPGFLETHSIQLMAGFQQRDTNNVLFSNLFANSRGYNDYYFSRMWRLSGNYHFPLLYPDWGFANLVYFLRIRANAFYDFTKVYSKDKSSTRNLRSVGGEIFFDTRWWNQVPVSFGIRLSHLLDDEIGGPTQRNVFEFVLPVSLIPR
jgi:hypothetical protein